MHKFKTLRKTKKNAKLQVLRHMLILALLKHFQCLIKAINKEANNNLSEQLIFE